MSPKQNNKSGIINFFDRHFSKKLPAGELLRKAGMTMLLLLPLLASLTVDSNPFSAAISVNIFIVYSLVLLSAFIWVGLPKSLRILLIPALCLCFSYSGFVWISNSDIEYSVMTSVYNTTISEATGFMRNPDVRWGLGISAAVLLGIIYLMHCNWKFRWAMRPVKIRGTYFAAFMLIVLAGFSLGHASGKNWFWNDLYPCKLIRQTYVYTTNHILITQAYNKTRENYVYQGPAVDDKPETYVLIVGESARAHNWSIYGYDRETNPLIAKLLRDQPENALFFPKITSAGRVTRISAASMLSPATAREFETFYNKPGLPLLFKRAGFKTFAASMQQQNSFYGSLPNMLMNDSHENIYLNTDSHDNLLLAKLDEYLKNPAPKKFIVLQLWGSHYDYDLRYPPEFAKFKNSKRGYLMDTYDNSLLYTDWILKQIINRIEKHKNPAMVFYSSDHGENLNDNNNGKMHHGIGMVSNTTEYEINVPMICYFNDRFRKLHANQVARIFANRTTRLSHDMISHTIIGLAGVTDPAVYYPHIDLSSKKYKPGKLYFAEDLSTVVPLKQTFPGMLTKAPISPPGKSRE